MMKFVVFAVVALLQGFQLKSGHAEPTFPQRSAHFKPSPRITGGEEATPHSLPYQVGLFIPTDNGTYFCGGSLLSPTTVLTAAHCAQLSDNIEVVLGAHKILEKEDTQVRVNSTEIILHPKWNSSVVANDIAIIYIPEVELNDNINVVPLPTSADVDNDYVGDMAKASGWGHTSDTAESLSDVLRFVRFRVVDNNFCNELYFGYIQDFQLCTNGYQGSPCDGDGGGPLVASTGELIGVASAGVNYGCESHWPPIFTRVTEYLLWIRENSDV